MTESRRAELAAFGLGFLAFSIQPVAGKLLLPSFGGGPSVWTACLLFFQTALLGGYALAHARAPRGIAAAALALIPSVLAASWASRNWSWPALEIAALLCVNVGAPYVMLAWASPALQRRYKAYRLYAWSNFGSLVSVPVYLVLIEPNVPLRWQIAGWLAAWAAWEVLFTFGLSAREAGPVGRAPAPAAAQVLHWVALSASGTALLAAATNQLTQEVFVTPFLWVIPLVLYLATFSLSFRERGAPDRTLSAVAAAVAGSAACVAAAMGTSAPLWLHLVAYPAAVFACCLCVHGELARARPEAERLTAFYLVVAAGGSLGTALVAVFAPKVFASNHGELFVAVAACCALGSHVWRDRDLRAVRVWSLLGTAGVALAALAPGPSAAAIESRRGFFGIVQVANGTEAAGRVRKLIHGRVMHGFQFDDDMRRSWPTAYYGRKSAPGLVLGADGGPRRIGVIGLGVGTLAAYGRPGDEIRFYEINPTVIDFARKHFTFLRDSRAAVTVAEGDARVLLDREPARQFDVLAIDAFSSDAIPAHLLTREAYAVYRRHLKPDGVLLFHISNRYLDLAPVVLGLSDRAARIATPADPSAGASETTWMAIGAHPALAGARVPEGVRPIVWTDDFSSLFSVWKPGR